MYLLCMLLHYGFFAPIRLVAKCVYSVTRALFLMTCVATGAYIVGCFAYGVYTGFISL